MLLFYRGAVASFWFILEALGCVAAWCGDPVAGNSRQRCVAKKLRQGDLRVAEMSRERDEQKISKHVKEIESNEEKEKRNRCEEVRMEKVSMQRDTKK